MTERPEAEGKPPEKNPEPSPRRRKRIGEIYREGALYSAPTIIIVYPIVGFVLGWLTVRYWNWPFWVPVVTTVAGLVEAIREVYRLSKKIMDNDRDE